MAQVEDLIHQYKKVAPVAAVIIEPIQSEGGISSVYLILLVMINAGDNHASAEFFKGLQQICHKV